MRVSSALTLLVALLFSESTLAPSAERGGSQPRRWRIPGFCGTREIDVSYLWWTNRAKIFHWRVPIEYNMGYLHRGIFVRLKRGTKKPRQGLFGVRLSPWPFKFVRGRTYEFVLGFSAPPDYILVDGRKVWDVRRDKFERNEVRFTYVPAEDGNPVLTMVKDLSYGTAPIISFVPPVECWFIDVPPVESVPRYPQFFLPRDVRWESIDPHLASKHGGKQFLPIPMRPSPLPTLPYRTSPVKIFMHHWRYYDDVRLPNFPMHGVDGFDFYERLHGDVEKMRAFLRELSDAGCVKDLLLGVTSIRDKLRGRDERKDFLAVRWFLKRIPGKVYLVYPEIDMQDWGSLAGAPDFARVRALVPKFDELNYFDKLRAILRKAREWKEALDTGIGANGRVVHLYIAGGPAFQGAYHYHAGADMFMNKNIHRTNTNIVVANARGAGRAYGKPYAFDLDTWDGPDFYNHHPAEVKQLALVYYFAGGKVFYAEMMGLAKKNNDILLNEMGKTYLDFARFAKTHPALGKQVVKIAVMRGFGDYWADLRGPATHWRSFPKWFEAEKDFNLLDIFFPKFGNYYRTHPNRRATGTPFGPVDFIPWDTPLKHLKTFDLVVFMGGPCAISEEQYENLKEYVRSGGTLVAALGHFKNEQGEYFKSDMTDLLGLKVKRLEPFMSSCFSSPEQWRTGSGRLVKTVEVKSADDVIELVALAEKAGAFTHWVSRTFPPISPRKLGKLFCEIGLRALRGTEGYANRFYLQLYRDGKFVREIWTWRPLPNKWQVWRVDISHVEDFNQLVVKVQTTAGGKFGVALDWLRFVPYKLSIGGEAEVLERNHAGFPLLIRNRVGKGVCYVFTSDFLTANGEESPRRLINKLAHDARLLDFQPQSDWLEYMVLRKGATYIIPIFNHGRGFFPSGNGYDFGPWEGRVKIDLKKLGLTNEELEAWRVVYRPKAKIPFALEPLEFSVEGDEMALRLKVEEFEEVVVGPKGKAKGDFFRG